MFLNFLMAAVFLLIAQEGTQSHSIAILYRMETPKEVLCLFLIISLGIPTYKYVYVGKTPMKHWAR
jgi:hypothetical protein